MTDLDAVALALFGAPRRRHLASLVRHLLGRALPDIDDVPPRVAGEDVVAWACRTIPSEPAPLEEAARLRREAAGLLRAGRDLGQQVVPLGAPDYPAVLAQIPDPPPCLWARGRPDACARPRLVAIVGARAASRPGLEIAAALAEGLAAAGVVVVSGLARGVDGAAHRAAVDAGGASIAVLGSGLDRIYPPEHRALAAQLAADGCVLSEHPPGMPPLAYHFPARNRIISGLVSAVVVVEASDKSGSLITAAAALEQGREVMAVPGPVAAGRHRGAHGLLKDGARLVETAADVLAELGWDTPNASAAAAGLDSALAELGLDAGTEDFSPDDVAAATGWSLADVVARGLLEIEGRIQRIGCGRFLPSRKRVLT
jgi:DNA processing protein